MSKLEITGTGLPRGTTIRLDGRNIEQAVCGLTLSLGMDIVPTVQMEISAFEWTRLDLEDVQVFLSDETRELLVRLGWTPPKQKADSDGHRPSVRRCPRENDGEATAPHQRDRPRGARRRGEPSAAP